MIWLSRLWLAIRILAVLGIIAFICFVTWAVLIEIAMERGI